MKWFLILIGLFWVILGTLTVFTTDLVKNKFCSRFKDLNGKKWAIVPIVVGILFLIAAPISRAKLYITILGILALLKGFYLVVVPQEKLKKHIDWWLNAKNSICKILGVIVLILGVLVLINS